MSIQQIKNTIGKALIIAARLERIGDAINSARWAARALLLIARL